MMKNSYVLPLLLCLLLVVPAPAQDFTLETLDPAVQSTGGAAWGDADGDGDLDLYIGNWNNQSNQLLLNDGQGQFSNASLGPALDANRSPMGVRWYDTDGDGDLDLIAATLNGAAFHYENLGDLVFTETRLQEGLYRDIDASDYDHDGDLDLVLVARDDAPNRLLENLGGNQFTLVADSPVSTDTGDSSDICWADIDGDGDEDLLVQNRRSDDYLYRNENGSFVRILDSPVTQQPEIATGCLFGDFDDDGDLDLFATYKTGSNRLYWNDGAGVFTMEDDSPVVTDPAGATATSAADFDLDGDLDLLAVNPNGANLLYLNDGTGSFTRDETSVLGQAKPLSATTNSVNWGDADGDGDLDLFVGFDSGVNYLYRNAATGRGWLQVRPVADGNTQGVGTWVSVKAVMGGTARWQHRAVRPAAENGQDAVAAHFGLGDAAVVDSLVVRWPGIETPQVRTNVAIDQVLTVAQEFTDGTFTRRPQFKGGNHYQSAGGVWGDYDNDGDEDLYVPTTETTNHLYRNDGEDGFTPVVNTTTTQATFVTSAARWADADGDGDLDLFATAFGVQRSYENLGDGTFANPVALPGPDAEVRSASFADYDLDGDLDLVMGVRFGGDNLLFDNNGAGQFTRNTASAFARDGGNANLPCWADVDGDGDEDLLMTNVGEEANVLYHNEEGTLVPAPTTELGEVGRNTGGCLFADLDNDGDLDAVLANSAGVNNALFWNDGTGVFTPALDDPIMNDGGNSYAVTAADYDLDGDLDLYFTNLDSAAFLYENTGDQAFVRRTDLLPGSEPPTANRFSASWADYDGDGDLDLFVPHAGEQDYLYRNDVRQEDTAGPSWLQVRLAGSTANTQGMGAWVSVKATLSGEALWQHRVMRPDADNGQNGGLVHFGLADAAEIDSVVVRWPGGDTLQVLTDVPVNRLMTIAQASGTATEGEHQPTAFTLHANYPNPFNPTTTLTFDLPETADVEVQVFDLLGRRVRTWSLGGIPAGAGHQFQLEASGWASGVYLYRVVAHSRQGTHVGTGRMLLLK